MSSPIFASSPSSGVGDIRHRSSSFGGPRLDLTLRPSFALGPFKLGHSLWHVLNYLRSQQSLFPQINITYDQTAPRLSPIVVVIQPNLHLVFHGVTQRLVMITLENLDASSSGASIVSPSTSSALASSEPSHRPVNLIYNGKLIYSRGSARSSPVALNRSTLHQILGPTYPGHAESSSISTDSLVSTAYGNQGNGASKDRNEFVLTYPGIAFCFTLKPDAPKDADIDKFQPVSTIHIFSGTDPNHPEEVLVNPSVSLSTAEATRSSARPPKGTLSPTSAANDYLQLNNERDRAALDTDAMAIRCPTLLEANIRPGRGVALHFAKSGVARTPSPLPDRNAAASPNGHAPHIVDLVLGLTTPQDALCDLGQPQRIFYKEDDRMRIHGSAAGHGARAGRDWASEASSSTDDSFAGSNDLDDSAFFYNYFDLGIDLLFSREASRMPSIAVAYSATATGQPRLEKVVCHTNVPGDALFQRYNRCPWRVVSLAATDANTTSTGKTGVKAKAEKSTTSTFSFEDHFDSTLNAGEDDRGMELDRGTCAEFKGSASVSAALSAIKQNATGRRQPSGSKPDVTDSSPEREHNPSSEVIVDLSTRLVGRQGMVLEVGKDGSMVGVVLF